MPAQSVQNRRTQHWIALAWLDDVKEGVVTLTLKVARGKCHFLVEGGDLR